jgi:hypothetical protein
MKNLPPSSRRSASLDSAFSTSSPTTPFFSLRIHTPSPKRLPKRFIYICTASVLAFTLLVGLSYHSHSYVTLPFFPSSDDTSFKIEPGKEGLAEIIKVFKGLPPYNVESYVTPDPLTFLGVQADASYRLESSNITVYREQLTSFIKNAFPASLQQSLVSGLDLYLPPLSSPPLEAVQYPYPTFPKKIWQTHKDRNIRPEDSWRIQIGYEYTFWDDAGLDTWVSNTFGKDSGIWWLWETLELGITVRLSLLLLYISFNERQAFPQLEIGSFPLPSPVNRRRDLLGHGYTSTQTDRFLGSDRSCVPERQRTFQWSA